MNDILWVTSNIYFDNECCFCGRPYVSLVAHKDRNEFWDANTRRICLIDDDDFDIGLIYKTNADEFENVLHELINWMRDHEQGIGLYENRGLSDAEALFIQGFPDWWEVKGKTKNLQIGNSVPPKMIEWIMSGIKVY